MYNSELVQHNPAFIHGIVGPGATAVGAVPGEVPPGAAPYSNLLGHMGLGMHAPAAIPSMGPATSLSPNAPFHPTGAGGLMGAGPPGVAAPGAGAPMGGEPPATSPGGDSYSEKLRSLFGGGASQSPGSPLDPWTKAGGGALQDWQQALSQMKDPNAYINSLMANYSQSPWAKTQTAAGMKASDAAAAASGMLGSGAQATQLQQQGQQISQADQQQYLSNLLGVHGQYLSGLGGISGAGEAGAQAQLQAQEAAKDRALKEEEMREKEKSAMWSGIGSVAGAVGSLAFL